MNIEFTPFDEELSYNNIVPAPASRGLPEWFKNMPTFTDQSKKFKMNEFGQGNVSIKWCNPFLDAMTSGYLILLPYDLFVEQRRGSPYFVWRTGGEDYVSMHGAQQISASMIPDGFNAQPYKFANGWGIKTPSGYSSYVFHPSNRLDLPFITLSGFVDTDTYNKPINLPFLIKDNFEGIIESGTPIAQIIPIKRESWLSKINDFSDSYVKKQNVNFLQHIYRSYKNHYWHRKDYR